MPQAPGWFIREMKKINPRLGVRFHYGWGRWTFYLQRTRDAAARFMLMPGVPLGNGAKIYRLAESHIQLGPVHTRDGQYMPLCSEVLDYLRGFFNPDIEIAPKSYTYECEAHGRFNTGDSMDCCPKCGRRVRRILLTEKEEENFDREIRKGADWMIRKPISVNYGGRL